MSVRTAPSNSDLFIKYLDTCKGYVKSRASENYYPTNVVAEAYTAGFKDGKNSGEKSFLKNLVSNEIEKFTQKAQQIYILSKTLVELIQSEGYSASGLHINLSYKRPSVIISVSDEFLNNDKFVRLAYRKIHENQNIYTSLFQEYLDMGIVAADNLDENLLREDGFGYTEIYK